MKRVIFEFLKFDLGQRIRIMVLNVFRTNENKFLKLNGKDQESSR